MIDSSVVLAANPYHITWDWSVFLSQLVGFAVIVFAIVKWVVPPVKGMMVRAQDTVRKQIEESEQATARLTAAKQRYDAALAEAQTELESMRADAHADAEFIIEKLREVAATEVERVRRQGRDQVLQLRRQLVHDLQYNLTIAMVDRTEERVRATVNSPQAQSDSIDRFLEDLDTLADGSSERQAQARWN